MFPLAFRCRSRSAITKRTRCGRDQNNFFEILLAGDLHTFVGELFLSNKLPVGAHGVDRMAEAGGLWPVPWQRQPRLDAGFDAKLQVAKPVLR